jgi:hypothetical protein
MTEFRAIKVTRESRELVPRDFRVMLVSKDCRDHFHKGLRDRKVFRGCLVALRDSRDRLVHRAIRDLSVRRAVRA